MKFLLAAYLTALHLLLEFAYMTHMRTLILPVLLLFCDMIQAAQWTISPMKDVAGNIFSPGGGISIILDVVYSEELGKFLSILKAKDNSLVVASSSTGEKWEVISSESWTWGYSEGKACDGNGALYLLIGNGVFRWPHTTWARSRVLVGAGNLDSIAIKGDTVVAGGWSSGLIYYSNNGTNFSLGMSDVPIEHAAATSIGFMAMSTKNTSNRSLLISSNGSYFGIVSSLPTGLISSQFIGDLGDSVLLAHASPIINTSKLGVFIQKSDGTYFNSGTFNDMGSVLAGNWPVRGFTTSKGGVLATASGGILEILKSGDNITFTKREDVSLKLKWRGLASGNGLTIMISETGVMGITDLDFSLTNRDIDNDGILDVYEDNSGIYISPEKTGTSPTVADTDADGFVDGFEITSGSNPNSATSLPVTQTATIKPAIEFVFPSASGFLYRVEASTDLLNWSIIEQGISGNGGSTSRFYPASEFSNRFFRATKY